MILRQFFRRENANQFYFKHTLKFHINWCQSANATQLGMERREKRNICQLSLQYKGCEIHFI